MSLSNSGVIKTDVRAGAAASFALTRTNWQTTVHGLSVWTVPGLEWRRPTAAPSASTKVTTRQLKTSAQICRQTALLLPPP